VSEERLKLATNATTDVIWDWTVDEDRAWCNERFAVLTGQTVGEGWNGRHRRVVRSIHPDDVQRVRESLFAAMDGGAAIWSETYRLVSPDATYRSVLSRAQIIRDRNGTPLRLVGAMSDMTENRLAEKQMAELSRQNEMILNTRGRRNLRRRHGRKGDLRQSRRQSDDRLHDRTDGTSDGPCNAAPQCRGRLAVRRGVLELRCNPRRRHRAGKRRRVLAR